MNAADAIAAVSGVVLTGVSLYVAFTARAARRAAERASQGVIEVDGKVYRLGQSVDGGFTALLETTRKLAHAEGRAEGEQAQRDRSSEAQQ